MHADLSDGELDLAVKELYGIDGVTYQIPPSIGNKTRLHLGTDEGFNYKALLFKSSFISNESFYWTLSSFLDSTVHIDSAFFTINVHRDI
mgnify:FL=1